MTPQNSYVEILTTKDDILGNGAFWGGSYKIMIKC